MRGIIKTVGCLVQRGVLPNLRRLSLGRARLTYGHLASDASKDSDDADGAGGDAATSDMRAPVRSTPCLAPAIPLAGEYKKLNTGLWGQISSASPGGWRLGPYEAPHVEVAVLPEGRQPPGQLFWVTDDVLPDLRMALGVRNDYDWERRSESESDSESDSERRS